MCLSYRIKKDAKLDDVELAAIGAVPEDAHMPEDWDWDVSHLYLYQITPATTVTFLSQRYRMVYLLDISPSATAVSTSQVKSIRICRHFLKVSSPTLHLYIYARSVCHSVILSATFDFSAYCGPIGLKLGWVVGVHHNYLATRWRPDWPPGGAAGV